MKIDAVDRRTSLLPILRLRAVFAAKGPAVLEDISSAELSPDLEWPPVVYASLVDHQVEVGNRYQKAERLEEEIRGFVEVVPPGSRIVLMVPQVVLNGSTWQETRSFLAQSGFLRAVVQFPTEALVVGGMRVGLLVLEKQVLWPSREGVIMADIGLDGDVINWNQVCDLAEAMKGNPPTTSAVWYQEPLEPDRIDPRFYLDRGNVRKALDAMQVRRLPLDKILFTMTRGDNGESTNAKSDDRLITANAIRNLQVHASDCPPGLPRTYVRVAAGNVVLTTSGDVGKAAVVPRELGGTLVGAGVVVLIPGGQLDASYLAVLLESTLGQKMLGLITKGTERQYIPMHELRTLQIPLPDMAKQKEIAATAMKLYTMAAQLREQAQFAEDKARSIFEPKV